MKRLKVAIVHHHLRGGGVTRIIHRALEALERFPVDVCVLSGEDSGENESLDDSNIGIIDGLSYGSECPKIPASELLKKVKSKAKELLGEEPDIWHIHNPTLGKNAAFTEMTSKLASEGKKVFFHIHDFAEDNRPSNYKYLSESKTEEGIGVLDIMCPVGNHVYYGVLNNRDYSYLKSSGVDEARLITVSNPVVINEQSNSNPLISDYIDIKKLYLYPVRVIPRKNIGELILWAALSDEGEHFATTLAPKNPKYLDDYHGWVSFSEQRNLPVTFEAGQKWDLEFEELLQVSDAIITTSIAEGFGLVFLESWLIEKPLLGRKLPDITSDFELNGIKLEGMYTSLDIPINWLNENELRTSLENGIKKLLKNYGKIVTEDLLSIWMDEIIKENNIDFSRLDIKLQKVVIDKLIAEPSLKKEVLTLNRVEVEKEVIQHNKRKVQKHYSIEKYGELLYKTYKELEQANPSLVKYLNPETVLAQFLSPKQFSLLRD